LRSGLTGATPVQKQKQTVNVKVSNNFYNHKTKHKTKSKSRRKESNQTNPVIINNPIQNPPYYPYFLSENKQPSLLDNKNNSNALGNTLPLSDENIIFNNPRRNSFF
jgi:hypothetical protein